MRAPPIARQADEDWRTFLLYRGRELEPGGRLVVLTMASDDEVAVRLCAGARRPLFDARPDGRRRLSCRRTNSAAWPSRPSAGAGEEFAGALRRRRPLRRSRSSSGSRSSRAKTASGKTTSARAMRSRSASNGRASRALPSFPSLAAALRSSEGGAARSAKFFNRLEAGMATRLAAAPARMAISLARMVVVKDDAPRL